MNEESGWPLRIGFVPLCDCAPLVVAQEHGLFARHGLEVELSREVGWATVRDKLIYRELEAAHAPAGMVLGASLGLGSIRAPCVTGLVLNLHGNAITLSNRLWKAGVRDGATLREHVRSRRLEPPLTFGVVFRYSSHHFLLRQWLGAHGIDADRDVRLVVVPPPQMARNLKAGNLDGYCSGEPWNTVAVQQQAGWVAATSAKIAPGHIEKVLLTTHEFATTRADEHLRLIAALYEACAFCSLAENRERLVELLARPAYLNTTAAALRTSLCGPFDYGQGRVEEVSDFHVFAHDNANEPTAARAAWVLNQLRLCGARLQGAEADAETAAACFRADLFQAATRLHHTCTLQPA